MTESASTESMSIAAPEWLRSFHFVGIGGAGMSGIALVLHKRGYQITGSDLKPSRYVSLLGKAGIPVSIGHLAGSVEKYDRWSKSHHGLGLVWPLIRHAASQDRAMGRGYVRWWVSG